MVHFAIFASGTGSNARKILDYFEPSHDVRAGLVISNKREAPVLQMAKEKGIATLLLDRKIFYETESLLAGLKDHDIDLIVLAGFLWLAPPYLVQAFPGRILNIHPALLPKFGGKGMYGTHVHQAVLEAGEKESGITVHLVDELYDHGEHLFQAKCPVEPGDTPKTLAHRVQKLEHTYYPQAIDQYIREVLPSLLSKTQTS